MEPFVRLRAAIGAAALAAWPAGAWAGIQTFDAYNRGLMAGGTYGLDHDNDGRTGGPGTRDASSVVPNDTAGIQLLMYGSKGTVMSINTLGPISVMRAQAPVSIGQNRNGELNGGTRGTIMATWDEFVGATVNSIVVTIFSSDGQDLLPIGIVNGNDPAETFDFWTWNFGVNDPVTWRNNMPAVPLISAEYKLSSNGGQTFYESKSISNLPNPWPGADPGTTQGSPGSGVNYIKLTYRVGQLPAPGTMALGGLCTLIAARRRRR